MKLPQQPFDLAEYCGDKIVLTKFDQEGNTAFWRMSAKSVKANWPIEEGRPIELYIYSKYAYDPSRFLAKEYRMVKPEAVEAKWPTAHKLEVTIWDKD